MRTKFRNADKAYNYFLDKIIHDGIPFEDTKALFNIGFNYTLKYLKRLCMLVKKSVMIVLRTI